MAGADHISFPSSQCDAIITATERATNPFLDANEDIERPLAVISAHASDAREVSILTMIPVSRVEASDLPLPE